MGYQQSPMGYQQSPMGYHIEQLNSARQHSRIGGSKVVSKVITRYLDKIKEVRAIIKELNDNKKKNKSKILTKRMLIKNLYSKIKIQREKEKEKQRINAAKKAK
jgi:BioD-like phosphotransacetylase family protein